VALHLPGQGEVALPADLQVEQDVGAGVGAHREAQLAGVHVQVDGVHAVPVEDGGDPPGTASTAGRSLARLAPGLGGQLVLGHGRMPPLRVWDGGGAASTKAARR
jgi:hypothetical protein